MPENKLQLYCSYCGQKIYEYAWIRENSLDYHQECFEKSNKKKEEEENEKRKRMGMPLL